MSLKSILSRFKSADLEQEFQDNVGKVFKAHVERPVTLWEPAKPDAKKADEKPVHDRSWANKTLKRWGNSDIPE